jgi:hypothetical protein
MQGRFDQGMLAVRGALGASLDAVFTYAGYVALLAVLLSLLLKEVPLRSRMPPGKPGPPAPKTQSP